tara:strand:+ start:2760 stop:3629 length:870 start_codon:yes stop_codon:yes gene_type:complete
LGKILVSGASGFIGSNLIPYLCSKNKEIVALTTSKNKKKIFSHDKLYWIYSKELKVPSDILRTCDTLIHLASAGVNQNIEDDLVDIFKANVVNSYDLILSCLNSGFKRIIYIGSCFEYGHMASVKKNNLNVHDALMPQTQYSATKAALTALLYPLTNYFNAEIRIIRAFQIYGPNENPDRLYPTIMKAIKTKKAVEITSGTQLKYFIPVENLIFSISKILNNPPKPNYFVLENQGDGRLMTVIDFAKSLFKDSDLKFDDLVKCKKKSRKGEPKVIAPDLNEKFQHQDFK